MDDAYEAYVAARSALGDDDFTKDGTPKLAALNDAPANLGYEKITTEDRDAFETIVDGDLEELDCETVTLTITDGPCNPVPLYVHGVGHFTIYHNQETTLPAEALTALHHVGGITIEQSKG